MRPRHADTLCITGRLTEWCIVDLFRLVVLAVICALNSGLALAVLIRKPKDPSHRTFSLAVLLVVGWLVLAFLSDQPALESLALPLNRLTLAAGILMGAAVLHFVLIFPKPWPKARRVWHAYVGLGIGLAAVTAGSSLVVAGVGFREGGTDILAGPLFPFVPVWFGAGFVPMVSIVIAKYRGSDERERTQLRYVLLGLLAFALVALVQGLVIPMFTGTYQTSELNTFASLILVGSAAYAMIAHRFMDLRFVVMRSVGYLGTLFLVSAAFVALTLAAQTRIARQTGIDQNAMLAVAFLATIVLFQSLKRITEHLTDHLFYRRTYDADGLLRDLGSTILSTLEQGRLAAVVSEELSREMRLSFAATIFSHDGAVRFHSSSERFAQGDAERLVRACAGDRMLVSDELDRASDQARALDDAGVRVLVPLTSAEERVGTLFLGMKLSGTTYTSRDIRFIETIARETAIAAKNAHLFHERNRRLAELTAMNQLSIAASASEDVDPLLGRALELVMTVTEADSGSIMLLDENGETLKIAASAGLPPGVTTGTRVPVGEGISGWVAAHREALLLVGDTDPRFRQALSRDDIACAISAPVMYGGRVGAVLSVNRSTARAQLYGHEDLGFVRSFATHLATSLENAELYQDLERTFLGTISALAAAVDAKDPYTYGHSSWVTHHATAIAKRCGLDEQEIHTLRIASILHDIGKIGIDVSILRKPEGLTDEERRIVQRHPTIGADILASLDFLKDAVPLILFHHERFDGSGYPSGISGAAIPLGARIIAVADAFDAMTSDRPYRAALTSEQAIRELQAHAGGQFDPMAVSALLAALAEEGAPPPAAGGPPHNVFDLPQTSDDGSRLAQA